MEFLPDSELTAVTVKFLLSVIRFKLPLHVCTLHLQYNSKCIQNIKQKKTTYVFATLQSLPLVSTPLGGLALCLKSVPAHMPPTVLVLYHL